LGQRGDGGGEGGAHAVILYAVGAGKLDAFGTRATGARPRCGPIRNPLALEHVSGPAHRLDQLTVVAEFAADFLDVDIDRPLVYDAADAARGQLGPAENAAGLATQDREEAELGAGQEYASGRSRP
ncbi:MAG: hypothetical protein ACRDQZ_12250, partial [Mycobacteriales bacterium]